MKLLKGLLTVILVLALSAGILFLLWKFVVPDEIVADLNDAIGTMKDSGITGEEYTFDTEFYPYYDSLSVDGQKLYAQVYANALAKEKTFRPVVDITCEEVENVVKLVYYDHPELHWMDSGYSYRYDTNKICIQITLKFNESVGEKECAAFQARANEIIEGAKAYDYVHERERYVYLSIINSTEYDANASIHQSPYSALVNGKSVCAGYARAFQYVMIELGIPTYYCAGIEEGHAWNIVKMSEGYYNVDLTWADKGGTEEDLDKYLNRSDNSLGYSHRRSGYSVLLPKCKAKKHLSKYD